MDRIRNEHIREITQVERSGDRIREARLRRFDSCRRGTVVILMERYS